jgi:hypothetical protein
MNELTNNNEKITLKSNLIYDKYKTTYTNLINLVSQLKFVYGTKPILDFSELSDMGLKIISDALARISNGFKQTRVTALYLIFSKKGDKLSLDEIHFTNKINHENQENTINGIINYCFDQNNANEQNFITPDFKRNVKDFFSDISKESEFKGIFDSIFLNIENENDCEYFERLYDSIKIILNGFITYMTANQKFLKRFHYIVIIYLDTLIIRDIFSRYFIKNKDLKIQFVATENKCHPDSALALYLSSSSLLNCDRSKYIGISHFCCSYCSLFLDIHGLDFRGISNKFDTKWKLPSNTNSKEQNIFMTKLDNINYEIWPIEISMSTQRSIDSCKKASGFISDDLCLYYKYYKYSARFLENTSYYLTDFEDLSEFLSFMSQLRNVLRCESCID